MAVRVAINGFGRIGRLILRAIIESGPQGHRRRRGQRSRSGRNQRPSAALQFGAWPVPGEVKVDGDQMIVNGQRIKVTAIKNPAELPHKELGVDIALECTGIFTSKEKAAAHLTAGAKRVLISAPADNVDLTVVYGVNHQKLTKDHIIVSNASCTTNCLAPVAKVLHDTVGIEHGFMTTIHSYTNDQPSLDQMHKDLYRARAAALNMIPTSTGAAKAVGLVLPELKGKLDGVSIRVPTPECFGDRPESRHQACDLGRRDQRRDEARGEPGAERCARHRGRAARFGRTSIHNPASASFALDQTKVIDGKFVRVMAWYDNEWGFSSRMADTTIAMAKLI